MPKGTAKLFVRAVIEASTQEDADGLFAQVVWSYALLLLFHAVLKIVPDLLNRLSSDARCCSVIDQALPLVHALHFMCSISDVPLQVKVQDQCSVLTLVAAETCVLSSTKGLRTRSRAQLISWPLSFAFEHLLRSGLSFFICY
jgi:hypothetical protein